MAWSGTVTCRLRRGEITAGQAPADVAEVLQRCAVARDLSGGWFDPWAMPGGVDPTGYVKGWAAQRALTAFGDPGLRGAMVNAVGDIASMGALGPGRPFRVGITDPHAPGRLVAVAELTGGIATSGTYERGGHLISPWTGRPEAQLASSTVTGPDLGLADALATALVAGEVGLAFLEPLDGYEGFAVTIDGRRRWTEGFPLVALAAQASGPPPVRLTAHASAGPAH
jgi:thiamine biosynthesis lipoprotein